MPRDKILKLEDTLDKIYKACYMKGRSYFLPYPSANLSANQLIEGFDKTLNESTSILSELVAFNYGNFTDNFGIEKLMKATQNLIFPNYINHFQEAMKFIRFRPYIYKDHSNGTVYAYVKMSLPYTKAIDLRKIVYLPRESNGTIQILKDQTVTNAFQENNKLMTFKNVEKCQKIKDLIMCEKVNIQNSCVSEIFNNENGGTKYCNYEEYKEDYEFTPLGNNAFYIFMGEPSNYEYSCLDGIERGTLTFNMNSNHPYLGIIYIEDNCILSTAYTTISNENGNYEIKKIDNEDLIWMDLPKVLGIFTEGQFIIIIVSFNLAFLVIIWFGYRKYRRNSKTGIHQLLIEN
ncbi:hypothetical protein ACFFRR_006106 [Megaselia abdita]